MPPERSAQIASLRKRIVTDSRTLIMGILNVTPDSFSDGGRYLDRKEALRHALAMASDGADIIDVGGESTRPGAREVSIDDEIARVVPVIESIVDSTDIAVSIDTRKSEVAKAALDAGAVIVNDVSGLRNDKAMAAIVRRGGALVVLMHMRGSPGDMQTRTTYKDLVGDIIEELAESVDIAETAGIGVSDIIVDPGIGFSKTAEQNLEIINKLELFKSLNKPICVGVSRKSFIGSLLGGLESGERLSGTIAASAIAVYNGAKILRSHDVREIREAARVVEGIANMGID